MGRVLETQQTGGFNHDHEKWKSCTLCDGSTDPCQLLSYPRLAFNELRDFPSSYLIKCISTCQLLAPKKHTINSGRTIKCWCTEITWKSILESKKEYVLIICWYFATTLTYLECFSMPRKSFSCTLRIHPLTYMNYIYNLNLIRKS